MLDFLPTQLKQSVLSCFASVYEVRIRVDKPVIVKGNNGLNVQCKEIKYSVSKKELEQIILRLCNHSLFSVESSLKNGFITSINGERVGLCGEIVYSEDEVKSIKNFSSIIIRLPNYVYGCSEDFVKTVNEPKSCLIFSPPFHGKTTCIRDLGRAYSDSFNQNVLYIDERDELGGGGAFNLGKNADVLRFSSKKFGFFNGVRAYNPDVIVCDEIMSNDDCKGVEFARNSGVKVIASAHADNIENLLKKQNLSKIIKTNTFDYILSLNSFRIDKIYGEKDWLNYL